MFEISTSPSLTDAQRARLVTAYGDRLRIVSDDTRSQHRNRMTASDRLGERLAEGLRPRRTRKATRPTKGSKERRLRDKKATAKRKADRRTPRHDD